MTWIRKGTKHVSLLWNVMSDVQRVKNSLYWRIFNDMDKKSSLSLLPAEAVVAWGSKASVRSSVREKAIGER